MHPEKLKLNHICGYLPYGLRMQVNDGIGELIGIGKYCLDVADPESVDSGMYVLYDECKPLLIPLSALTKEQWIEVFKAGTAQDLKSFQEHYPIIQMEQEDGRLIYFDCVYLTFNGYNFFNQFSAFTKLYELHADLYGLIDAGLALNKLDYEK